MCNGILLMSIQTLVEPARESGDELMFWSKAMDCPAWMQTPASGTPPSRTDIFDRSGEMVLLADRAWVSIGPDGIEWLQPHL